MDAGTMLANVGTYLAVISALAFGVERILDLIKTWRHDALVKRACIMDEDGNELSDEQKKDVEETRRRKIRLWAIPVGCILAFLAEADTFALLGIDSPRWFGLPIMGYLLSGLAASRGSAFWHDIVDLVGVIKATRGQVQGAKS